MPFGSSWWRKPLNRLLRCSERLIAFCDTAATDGCCGVVACTYCLRFEGYSGTVYGSAGWTGTGWSGTIGGSSFLAYWARSLYGECELVVLIDGYEVYRKSCYEGQSCRDISDAVYATLGDDEGTLYWEKHLLRPLPVVRDYTTNCLRKVCSGCDCTCECLCVSILDGYGLVIGAGEICDISYDDCDLPVWSGTVGGYDITVTMDDNCGFLANINGEEHSLAVSPYTSVCDNFTAQVDLGNVILEFRCKVCTCSPAAELCCPERDCPGLGPNPFPDTLTLSIEDPEAYGCWDMTGTLTLGACPEINYTGTAEATCTWCDQTFTIKISVVLTCSSTGGWLLTFETPVPDLGDCSDVTPTNIDLSQLSCDPILLQAEDQCLTCGSWICQGEPGPIPMPFPRPPFCGLTISVFEAA